MNQYNSTSAENNNRPVISVVVPVYNMEALLPRCVDSILQQTYENLEIILVNDCSTDDSAQIIKQYVEQDDRVKAVNHEKNRGLFQARITGAEQATGKYLAFVDSDDYVSVDWFRLLLRKAEETQSDITVGEWCYDHNGTYKEFLSLDPFRLNDYLLEGDEILERFMEQEGICFSWTVVWNKLYRMELWKKCEPDFTAFSNQHGHMLMWEDIAFSSGLWSRARRVSNEHGAYYFYYKHEAASTSINKSKARNQKYIQDASSAMRFMEQMLIKAGRMNELGEHFTLWRNNAANLLYHDLVLNLGLRYFEKDIRNAFCMNDAFSETNTFYYQTTTPLHNSFFWWDEIKREIVSPKTAVVSFDVFDTLVQRPFLHPTDLFYLLSDKLNEHTSAYVDFYNLRTEAERICRRKKDLLSPSVEEITLEEIYAELSQSTALSENSLEKLKDMEVQLELSFCRTRKSGKELFELAKFSGKRIIICSDMYLSVEVIKEILENNGYKGISQIYVSSDLMLTKAKGSLYKYIQRDLGIRDPNAIYHVGDNWQSDVASARNCGWRSGHLTKAPDMIQNINPGIYAGEGFSRIFTNNNSREDLGESINRFPAMRNVIALSANRFFDTPYVSVQPTSDFNANPNVIGYSILGPHLLALSEWIEKLARERSIPTIHFVARDGYMVKRAFDQLNRSGTKTSYIQLSRKSLILADIDTAEDLYSIYRKINILHCSPKHLLGYLKPIVPSERNYDEIKEILRAHSLYYDRFFQSEDEFLRCVKVFNENVIDMTLLPIYKEKLRKYFAEIIHPGDYIFDIGYSGRPESALSNLLGFPIGSLYIHVNSDIAAKRQARYNCPSESFYAFKPKITGVIREHLLMELGPSTIGYVENNGTLEPLLEAYNSEYCSTFVTCSVQRAAMEFIEDYITTFGQYRSQMVLQSVPLSAPLEYYLHYSKPFDRQLFSTLTFEDALGEGKTVKALDFWNNEIAKRGLCTDGQSGANRAIPAELSDLYMDGLFVKFYRKINMWFPKGGRAREIIKRISSVFVR